MSTRTLHNSRAMTLAVAVLVLAAACSSASDEAADTSAATTISTAGPTTTQGDDPLLIETGLGAVRGAASAVDGIRNFLDIPYAEAPIGRRAFEFPVPVRSHAETLDATRPGPSCPQGGDSTTGGFVTTPPSDPDCLHLNIWTPDDAEDLPVMVWIHGGSFTSGSAASPYYNGDDLAAEGAVVVSMNYRLGPQGFLATEEMAEATDDGSIPEGGTAGNFGLLDQQAALRWVQANIEAFGGDPANVTIFGESAGGFSVCGHLATLERTLFQRAIVQSGGGCEDLQSREDVFAAGQAYMDQVGCDDLACLRGLSDDELLAAPFDPELVADGFILTKPALDWATDGGLDSVLVLIGANADESTLFTLRTPEPSDQGLIELAGRFTDDPAALLALYPPGDYDTNLDRFRALATDATMVCPGLAFAGAVPQGFAYHFTYVSDQFLTGLGATHGFELAPLFAHPEGLSVAAPGGDADDLALSDEMQESWVAFATTGDPGDAFEPFADDGQVAVLDVPITRTDEIRDGRCPDVTALTRD